MKVTESILISAPPFTYFVIRDKFSLKEHQLVVELKTGGVENWSCMVNLMLYLVLGIIHVKQMKVDVYGIMFLNCKMP